MSAHQIYSLSSSLSGFECDFFRFNIYPQWCWFCIYTPYISSGATAWLPARIPDKTGMELKNKVSLCDTGISLQHMILILTLNFFHDIGVSDSIVKLSLWKDINVYLRTSDQSKPGSSSLHVKIKNKDQLRGQVWDPTFGHFCSYWDLKHGAKSPVSLGSISSLAT